MFFDVRLPDDLRAGDRLYIGTAGAYTTAYASRFNGFDCRARTWSAPLRRPRRSSRGWRWPSFLPEKLAQHVVRARLRLLDARDVLGLHDDDVVGEPLGGDPPPVVADERDRRESRGGAPRRAPRRCSPSRRSSRARSRRRPPRPNAISWRVYSAPGPMSFASAVRIAGSSVRSRQRLPGQPCGAARRSATRSIASVAEPPLPNAKHRAARVEALAQHRRRGLELVAGSRSASASRSAPISRAFISTDARTSSTQRASIASLAPERNG